MLTLLDRSQRTRAPQDVELAGIDGTLVYAERGASRYAFDAQLASGAKPSPVSLRGFIDFERGLALHRLTSSNVALPALLNFAIDSPVMHVRTGKRARSSTCVPTPSISIRMPIRLSSRGVGRGARRDPRFQFLEGADARGSRADRPLRRRHRLAAARRAARRDPGRARAAGSSTGSGSRSAWASKGTARSAAAAALRLLDAIGRSRAPSTPGSSSKARSRRRSFSRSFAPPAPPTARSRSTICAPPSPIRNPAPCSGPSRPGTVRSICA